MRTYNEDRRDLPNAYKESSRQYGQSMFIGAGIFGIGTGAFVSFITPAGILFVLLGIACLAYSFTYYKK